MSITTVDQLTLLRDMDCARSVFQKISSQASIFDVGAMQITWNVDPLIEFISGHEARHRKQIADIVVEQLAERRCIGSRQYSWLGNYVAARC